MAYSIITPTSGGSVTDAAGNVWTLSSAGNLFEGATQVPDGNGTGGLTVVNGVIWAQDANSGTWYTYVNGGFVSQGTATPTPTGGPIASTTSYFTVSGGKVLTPSGSTFIGRGVAITDSALSTYVTSAACTPLLTLFPGTNIVRIACFSYFSASTYSQIIGWLTAKNIVVCFENHQNFNVDGSNAGDYGSGSGVVFTGTILSTESTWYTNLANQYLSNPYVWFGTNNEPSYNPSLSALSTWQQATYNAIRGTGNNTIIEIEQPAGGNPGTMGSSGGLTASVYNAMTGIIFGPHFYPWVVGGDKSAVAQSVFLSNIQSTVTTIQTITSKDGTVPVGCFEFGPSTVGPTIDPGGMASIKAVLQATDNGNLFCYTAWLLEAAGYGDDLLASSTTLTTYGQAVAADIAGKNNASPDNTIIFAGSSASITDTNGHVWAINSSGHVTADGTDPFDSANVVAIAYENGKIWQENSSNVWYYKVLPTDAWAPTAGTTTSPIPGAAATFTESAQLFDIASGDTGSTIYNRLGEKFTWVASNGGQVAQNGVADPATSNVTQILYYNHLVYWQQSGGVWFYKANAGATYTGPVSDPRPAAATGTRKWYLHPGGNGSVWNTPLGDGCVWGANTDVDTIAARHGGFINTYDQLGSAIWLSQSASNPKVSFSGHCANYNIPGQYAGNGTPLNVTAYCVDQSYAAGGGDGHYNFIDTIGNPGRVFCADFQSTGAPSKTSPVTYGSSYSGIGYFSFEDATSNSFGEDWETGQGTGCQAVGLITAYDLDPAQNPNLIPGTTLTKIQHVLRYMHDPQYVASNNGLDSNGDNSKNCCFADSWPQLYPDYQDKINNPNNYMTGSLKYGTLLGIPSTTVMPATNPSTSKAWTDAGKQIWWCLQHYGSIQRDSAGGGYHLSVDGNPNTGVSTAWYNDAVTDLPAIVKYLCPLRNQHQGDTDVSTNPKNGPGNRLNSGPPPLANAGVGYTPSVNYTTVTGSAGGFIIDEWGTRWGISANGQVTHQQVTDAAVVVETNMGNVTQLAYVRRQIWALTSDGNWHVKTYPADSFYLQTPTNPIPSTITPFSALAQPNTTLVSADKTTVPPSASIIDANSVTWAINASGQVTVNGTADTSTSNVVKLAFVSGTIWYENSAGYWYAKARPTDAWLPNGGTTTNPLTGLTPSPDNTIVKAGSTNTIIDANGHVWGINSAGNVTVDGAATYDNANVAQLAYEGGKIWQENSSGLWWYKTVPTDTWLPTGGTATSPIPALVFTESAQGTVITTTSGGTITDSTGETFGYVSTNGGQVTQNGTADATTANVTQILYYNHNVYWQQAGGANWFYKGSIAAAYAGPVADPRLPAYTESAQGTVITPSNGATITDSTGERFTYVSTNNGQVAQNGVTDSATSFVTLVLYWNHNVYTQINNGSWYYKNSIAATYVGPVADPRRLAFADTTISATTFTPKLGGTESVQGTISSPGNPITLFNAAGETFAYSSAVGGQILQNGVVDASATNVNQLLYWNHLVYWQQAGGNWYYKASAAAAYAGPVGDPRTKSLSDVAASADNVTSGAVAFVESASGTVVTAPGSNIVDSIGETFALTGASSGHYQILQKGTVDTAVPATVSQLLYYNHLVYYADSSGTWHSKATASASYATVISGDPRYSVPPAALTDSASSIAAFIQTVTPFTESASGYRLTAPGQMPYIYDRLGEYFALSGTTAGQYQILQNGAVDTTVPAIVSQLLYYNQLIYYGTSTGTWFAKASIAGTYVSVPGDPTANNLPPYLADTVTTLDTFFSVAATSPISLPTPTPTPVATPAVAVSNAVVAPTQVQPAAPVATAAAASSTTGQTTLLLDSQRWDLVLDANGNIAVASPPYSVAQDAASAIRLFSGELWYNTEPGVPYFTGILGQQPPVGVLKNAFVTAATSVPDVTNAKAYITSLGDRQVTGQVQILTSEGITVAVSGTLQTAPILDANGNPLMDANGNIIFSVVSP